MHQVRRGWSMIKPVFEELQSGEWSRIQRAAQMLQSSLSKWREALSVWSKLAERQARTAAWVTEKVMFVQAAIDLYTMRGLIGPLVGRGRAMAFVLPGIGGVRAGGAATGIRVVISAEWVQAMQHLIAIGAITSVELAKLASISSIAMSTPNGVGGSGGASGPGGKAGSGSGAQNTTPPQPTSQGTPRPVGPIRNAHLAGKTHPKTGVPFDKDGYPDFSAYRHPDVPDVRIELSGSRSIDFARANAAGLKETPAGYTWHHHQDSGLMQLVEANVHKYTGHTGGFKR